MEYNPIRRRLCDISSSSSFILFNRYLQMQGLFQSHLLNFHDWLLEIKKKKNNRHFICTPTCTAQKHKENVAQ